MIIIKGKPSCAFCQKEVSENDDFVIGSGGAVICSVCLVDALRAHDRATKGEDHLYDDVGILLLCDDRLATTLLSDFLRSQKLSIKELTLEQLFTAYRKHLQACALTPTDPSLTLATMIESATSTTAYVNLDDLASSSPYPPCDHLLRDNLLSRDKCEQFRVFPVTQVGRFLLLAMQDTNNIQTIDDINFLLGLHVLPIQAQAEQITRAIERTFTEKG